ncbi:MAG TPA: SHOCT domain-containing protein [Candidatus Limnocylindria bacterium]|jgi:fatty acid desaturase|nr:SHOCT domain-containing protein [Candidatus Limnocylindria bacterium]
MHASTRILLLLAAAAAIAGGWWILLAFSGFVEAVLLGAGWTVLVLIVMRVLFVSGFSYNRFTLRRREARTRSADHGAALATLAGLRDQGLISVDEFAAKRAGILERM